jgi:hypothetical protein
MGSSASLRRILLQTEGIPGGRVNIGSVDESVRHHFFPAVYTEIRLSKDEEPLTRKREQGSMSALAVTKGMANGRPGWRREHNMRLVRERGAEQDSTLYSPN